MSLINFVYFCDRTASVKLPFLYTSNMNTTSKSTIRRATNYMYVKKFPVLQCKMIKSFLNVQLEMLFTTYVTKLSCYVA